MLTLEFGSDTGLEIEIFGDTVASGERVLLINDGVPIGTAVFTINNESLTLLRIGILKEYRRCRFGDFFTRALLYKLSLGGLDLNVACQDEYYAKFGFEYLTDGTMRVANEKLTFPSDCGCH